MMLTSWRIITVNFFVVLLLFSGSTNAASDASDYFKITVVDDQGFLLAHIHALKRCTCSPVLVEEPLALVLKINCNYPTLAIARDQGRGRQDDLWRETP